MANNAKQSILLKFYFFFTILAAPNLRPEFVCTKPKVSLCEETQMTMVSLWRLLKCVTSNLLVLQPSPLLFYLVL